MNNQLKQKSRLFVIGSFLILMALIFMISPLFKQLREEVFSEMKLKIYEKQHPQEENQKEEIKEDENFNSLESLPPSVEQQEETPPTYNYNYIGYLEIPKLGFKRGFVDKNSKYNNIEYNITISSVSDFPDKEKGNFIIMGHSGYGYAAFFANLHKISIGDQAIVTYKDQKYTYQLVNTYLQEKTGKVAIFRDFSKKALTLITCTYQDSTHQTIFVFEPV